MIPPLGPKGRRRKRRFGRSRTRRGPVETTATRGAAVTPGERVGETWGATTWFDEMQPVVDEWPMPTPEPEPEPEREPAPPLAVPVPDLGERPSPRPPAAVAQALRPSGSSRLQKRRQRTRRRRLGGVASVVALGLVAVLVAAFVVNEAVTRDDDPPVVGRTQRTLLLQVRAANGLAQSSVLVGHDPAKNRAAMVFVPPGVLALAPGLGTVPFEQALQLRGATASRGALSELLGVTVDHDWTFTEAGFVALIDRLGGVRVDVDVDVVAPVGGGRKVLLVSPGDDQDLTGADAIAFAKYLAPGEDQLGALPRFQEVLEGILDKVSDPADLVPILTAVGRAAPATLSPAGLADFVAGLAADRRAEQVSYASLPVVRIESGAPRLRYRLDEVAALELIKRDFAPSVPEGRFDGDKRVIIQNGVGAPGFTTTAQQKLSSAGFDIVKTGNANRFDHATSVILVRDATAASSQLGAEVARVLGLKPAAVRVNPQRNTVTDVIVILGRDYRP
ncbi:MAG TPA: LCP family protein [Mycobacteriales bacterium]|nr:LCP family protein [Mycobacteriales bacterium]